MTNVVDRAEVKSARAAGQVCTFLQAEHSSIVEQFVEVETRRDATGGLSCATLLARDVITSHLLHVGNKHWSTADWLNYLDAALHIVREDVIEQLADLMDKAGE